MPMVFHSARSPKPFFTFGLNEEKMFFIENLAMLLSSGMDMVEALAMVKRQMQSHRLQRMVSFLEENVSAGVSFGQALGELDLFPPYMSALIMVGETSGKLHESLSVIVVQEEKNRSFRSKINSAMMYPVFVLSLAAVVGIGIAWFILPRLATVFSQLNVKLPTITKLLIDFGNFLGHYGWIVIPSTIGVVVVMLYLLFGFKKTRFIGQYILFLIPGIRRLIIEIELARFGHIMHTLLSGGLPILDALQSLAEASQVHQYKKIYLSLRKNIEDGLSFEQCFARIPHVHTYIPLTIQSLIVAAEESGRLRDNFKKIAEIYEGKSEVTTKNMSVILEPVLLVLVWIGVMTVALAVILPIYSLIGGFNEAGGYSARAIDILC